MSFCANQESYYNNSDIREHLSKAVSDEFHPFKTQPNKHPLSQHNKKQSEIESNKSHLPSRLDIAQLTIFKNPHSANILYYLKIKKIISKFRELIMKKASLLPQTQIIKLQQLSIYQEKYLTYQKKLSGFQTYFILDPTNPFILFQDSMILLLILSLLLLIPYFWSFEENESPIKNGLIFFGSILLVLDALSKLNTAIMDKGNIIHDRIEILKQSLLKVFFQDVVFIINLNYLTNIQSAIFIAVFCVLGFVKFYQYFEKLLDVLDLPLLYKEILSLVKLLVVIILVAHIIACFWHYIGITTIEQFDISWITVKNLQNETPSTQYIYSYYWAIVTMVTVGYGDICPQNRIEVLCCTFIMIISCAVFAFSLNKVGQVIQNLNDQQAESREVMRTLTGYMKQHSVPNQLQGRVRNYLQYIMSQKEYKINAQQIINTLSSDLKIELMYNVFSNLTNNCQLFSLNFTPSTIKKLSLLLQPQLYSPGDVIFTQNEIDDCSLYFVDQGTISLIESQTKTTILQCTKGSYFGECSFFTLMPHSFTAISKTFSRVYIVKRKDFVDALTIEEQEQFLAIQHSFMLKQPIQGYKCQLCQNGSHELADCNYIKYTPDIERVILKYKQERQFRDINYQRYNKRKYHCLFNLDKIQHCQNEFAILLDEDASEEYDIQQGYSSQRLSDEQSGYKKNNTIVSLNNHQLAPPKPQNNLQQKSRPSLVIKLQENQSDVQKPAEVPSSMQIPTDNVKSTNDLLSKQNIPKIFSRIDNRQLTHQLFILKHLDEFDKMKLFTRYLLHNNYNVVIAGCNKFNKIYKRFVKDKSKYRLVSQNFAFTKITMESQRKKQKQILNQ